MAEVTRVSAEIAGTEISLETGRMAKQASGAVVVRTGDTMVLSTATAGNVRDVDFLPLTVDVEERMYAAGKIPGSFFKREGRSGEKGTLTARMIDRPLRPLFPKDFRNDVQLVATVLSTDQEQDPSTLAVTGASLAMVISDIPHNGPVACVRIGMVGGELTLNPSLEELADSQLDLVVAGTADAISMVEAGAKQVSEEVVLRALRKAHEEIQRLCAWQLEIRDQLGAKPDMSYPSAAIDPEVSSAVSEAVADRIGAAARNVDKAARERQLSELKA